MRRIGKWVLRAAFVSLVIAVVLCFPRATRFHGHTDTVCCAVFAPDGRHFASYGSFDNSVRIWDGETGKQLAVLRHDKDDHPAVTFSPDSKLFAMGGMDMVVNIRQTSDGTEVRRFVGHDAVVRTIAFGPDGKTVASGDAAGIVRVWEVSTGREILSIRTHHEYIREVVYSPDGTLLASGGFEGWGKSFQLWDAKTGKELRSTSVTRAYITCLRFSPGSETLFVAHQRGFSLWDVATGQERLVCEQPKWLIDADEMSVDQVAFSPDGRTLAVGHEEAIGLWDLASGKNTYRSPRDEFDHLLRLSDRLLLGTDSPEYDPHIADVAFRPNGDLMLLGCRRNTVVMWRATSVPLKK